MRHALKPTAAPSVFAVGPFPDDQQAGATNAPPSATRTRLQKHLGSNQIPDLGLNPDRPPSHLVESLTTNLQEGLCL
ncbi:unnamed protein product [Boreogadus saida]